MFVLDLITFVGLQAVPRSKMHSLAFSDICFSMGNELVFTVWRKEGSQFLLTPVYEASAVEVGILVLCDIPESGLCIVIFKNLIFTPEFK
jgi:hypothetical protein